MVVCLTIAMLASWAITAVFLSAALTYARQRDEHKERGDRLDRENKALVADIVSLRGRLTRRRTPLSVVKGGMQP